MNIFFNTMEFTADRIEADKNILLSLLGEIFLKIKYWWNPKEDDLKQTVLKVSIRCSKCGKETMTDVNSLNTIYQDIITTFVLNTMLQNVDMLWIIENHEHLKYYMAIQNSYCLTGVLWYNTSICKNIHVKLVERFIITAKTNRYHIMCFIDEYETDHESCSCDDGRSGGGCPLPTNSTTEAL